MHPDQVTIVVGARQGRACVCALGIDRDALRGSFLRSVVRHVR
jgi:hypothetical protein